MSQHRADVLKPYAGWVERVAYQMMDHLLKTGWTPERAASFYGGISETKNAEYGCLCATAWLPEVTPNREGIGSYAIDHGNCADRSL